MGTFSTISKPYASKPRRIQPPVYHLVGTAQIYHFICHISVLLVEKDTGVKVTVISAEGKLRQTLVSVAAEVNEIAPVTGGYVRCNVWLGDVHRKIVVKDEECVGTKKSYSVST